MERITDHPYECKKTHLSVYMPQVQTCARQSFPSSHLLSFKLFWATLDIILIFSRSTSCTAAKYLLLPLPLPLVSLPCMVLPS